MDSLFGWKGGKKLLSNKILSEFPKDKVDRYIEVFAGAAWIFFKKDYIKGQLEVINDVNNNLINLYRCIKENPEQLQKEFDFLQSRAMFIEYRDALKSNFLSNEYTNIKKAAMYLYIIKSSFGCDRRSFSTRSQKLYNIYDKVPSISKRLKDTIIENLDFEHLMKTYDRNNALFYCDPPYFKAEKYYDNVFTESDHYRLKNALSNLKGKFILSYNDCDFIRNLYKDFNIISVSRNNNLSLKRSNNKYEELIIKNF